MGLRTPILVESKLNARWSVDFVHDQLACGRRFRILDIVDDVTRDCLAAIPDTSISGRRVARELTALIKQRGKPGMIVSDNGTEFTSNGMLVWRRTTGSSGISSRQESRCRMASARVSTGACATSFSTRACSSTFTKRDQGLRTGSTITTSGRPHSALGYLTPAAYAANLSATRDRLRNPDQLSRSHVAPPAPNGVTHAEALIAAG